MKPVTTIAVVFLSLIALAHLVRLLLGWSASLNGMDIPVWASGVAFVITGALAFMLWRESRA